MAAEVGKSARHSTDHWSLQPLNRPSIPRVSGADELRNPIDHFVRAKLADKGLRPSPEADRRTLIRRLYFDLMGLPPTWDQVEDFVRDTDPRAYERRVEELLASPHHGERWARHWLDVVHYGETHGYDKDKPRPNAWPYRDYVIRSFNSDKPYGRFVREQIAGDMLYPGTRDGIEALGFISAGPWDFIGHAEVPETKIDGKVARHLDRDDMVATTMQTFNSLTVQCAQCHDHKFDPISQEDYYRLQAVFAAVDRADKKYDWDPDVAARRKALETRLAMAVDGRKLLETEIESRAGKALKELDEKIRALRENSRKSEALGFHSAIETVADRVKWVQVDLGAEAILDEISIHPTKDDFNGIGEGFGFPVRYKVEIARDPEFKREVEVIADHSNADQANPKIKALTFRVSGKPARYVRVTAVRLALRMNDYIFAIAELRAMTAGGTNVALGKAVTSLDSIEAPVRWARANLTDGWYPGIGESEVSGLVSLKDERRTMVEAVTSEADRGGLTNLDRELSTVRAELEKLPAPKTVYIGSVHKGSGAFAGTGGNGGKARTIHLLSRGDVTKPGKVVEPGGLSCVPGLPSGFDLDPAHGEGERRAALARWITRQENPLTWRSIVNRVWQFHFGRGLVDSPNDFGRMGEMPSHPELLDWLASTFRDGDQSLKALHRLIVTSATYRQSSARQDDPAAGGDSGNRLLWRQNRRKLEAEAVRDAILVVSGKWDASLGGPSFQDFIIDKPNHSPHYEYHLHDPEDPRSHRRSVYRFIVRSQQQPFMTVLDCADPSMQVGKRNESVSPLQALSLLNHSYVLAMAGHFSKRLERDGGTLESQVSRGFYSATGREPTAGERSALVKYAGQFGLQNCCRLLFNLNEFTFVD